MAVPKIRFPGFTEDWEQRKLGAIATFLNGRAYKQDELLTSGKYKVLRVGNFYTNDRWYYSDLELADKFYADKGDLLYTWSASFGPHIWLGDKVIYHYHIWKVVLSEYILKDFALQILEKDKQNILSHPNGSTMIHVTKVDMENKQICIPYLAEQQKIGNFFKYLDETITLHQRKLESMKLLKKSLLQKMFPKSGETVPESLLQKMFPKSGETVPEVRFPGFTDAWEQRKFVDFAQRESTLKLSCSDCPSVEYEDVIAEEGRLNKDIRQKEIQKTGIYFNGSQVLYGKLRPYLHNWLNPDFTGVAVGDWWVLRPSNMDKSFLYRLLQTDQFDAVANQSSGSKMPRADWKLVSNTEFIVPHSEKEQHKIAEFFNSIDDLITLHQRKVEILHKLKKSLLQQMFV